SLRSLRSLTPNPLLPALIIFFFYGYGDHRDLHSFPTRRSSDLGCLSRSSSEGSGAFEAFPDRVPFQRASAETAAVRTLEGNAIRSEEHTSELQSRENLVCRLLLEKKKKKKQKK